MKTKNKKRIYVFMKQTTLKTNPKLESFISVPLPSFEKDGRCEDLTTFQNTSKTLFYFRGHSYKSWSSLLGDVYCRYEHCCKDDVVYKSLLKSLSEAPFHAYGLYVCAPVLYEKMISFIKEELGEKSSIESPLLPPDHTAAFVIDTIIFDIIDKVCFIAENDNDINWHKDLLNGDVDKLYKSIKKTRKDIDLNYFREWVDFFSCFFEHANLDLKNNKISSVKKFSFINDFLIRRAASNIKDTFELSLNIDEVFIKKFLEYIKDDDRFIKLPYSIK